MDVGASSLEKVGIDLKKILLWSVLCGTVLSCATKVPVVKSEELKPTVDFEKQIQIVEDANESSVTTTTTTTTIPKVVKSKSSKTTKSPKTASLVSPSLVVSPPVVTQQVRQPDIESSIGFDPTSNSKRRPLKDPFRVGEKVVHAVTYFAMNAGFLTLETKNFVQVNGKKSYQFKTSIRSSDFFSSFYSVDDVAVTMVDFESLVPWVYKLSVKESGHVREAQWIFDPASMSAKFWEKKVTKKNGPEERQFEWEIQPFAQNVFSTAFYMRVFDWSIGSENKFRVAHDKENLVFSGKAIRKEKLKTAIGEFDTIVIKPEFTLHGKFQPSGENYIWITDDERKLVVRIESKIRIGSLVSEVIELVPGQNP